MKKKLASGIMLTLLFIGMLTLVSKLQPVKAEPSTIYVDDDNTAGPWDGTPEHPYQNITSALEHASTNDTIFVRAGIYYENIVVNKSVSLVGENKGTTVIHGGGIQLAHVVALNQTGITVDNFSIQNGGAFGYIKSYYPNNTISNNHIEDISVRIMGTSQNIIINNTFHNGGFYLAGGSNNLVAGNAGKMSSHVAFSNNNTISNNFMTWDGGNPIKLWNSKYNSIFGNEITDSMYGLSLDDSSDYNRIYENDILRNSHQGIILMESNNNSVYHNNFINNTEQVGLWWLQFSHGTSWDNGYPSGGNYWSNYNGTDYYRSPYQNETGSDGIGDTPYIIDENNTDSYPLVKPFSPHDIGITNVTTSKIIVGKGYPLPINLTIVNYGIYDEIFNVTVYANTTIIKTLTDIALTRRNSTTIIFMWYATSVPYGVYTINTTVTPVPEETDTTDNTSIDGTVIVTIPSDLNGDGHVNDRDLDILAAHWWFPQYYDVIADIDMDGKVNDLDLDIMASNWWKKIP